MIAGFESEGKGTLMNGFAHRPRRRRHHGRRSGQSHRQARSSRGYPLGRFACYYFVASGAVLVTMLILPPLAIIGYFVAGFCLNRCVLSQMQWHCYTTTLADVARAKLVMLVTWPVAYASLFLQIALAQWL